jgi:hypothetical protein
MNGGKSFEVIFCMAVMSDFGDEETVFGAAST